MANDKAIWQRSTIVRFLRWLFSKRHLRFALKLFVGAVVVVAVYYCEEDWLGKRAWTTYLSESGLTQAQLNFRSYIPKPVPDDQNFAATPVIKQWFTKPSHDQFKSDHFSKIPGLLGQPLINIEKKPALQHVDLAAWQNGLNKKTVIAFPSTNHVEISPSTRRAAATAVLVALQDDDAVIQSLRVSSGQSKSVYPINYLLDDPWQILLPHEIHIKELAVRLELKACAELADGDSAKAFDDVMLTLYLADSLTNETIMVSYLVRAECVHAAIQPIWEGIADRHWSDSQLQEMESRMLHFNFIREFEQALETERAMGVFTVDLTKKKGVSYLASLGSTEPTIFGGVLGTVFDCAIPSGWFAFEKVNYCRSINTLFTNTFDSATRTVLPLQAEANRQTFHRGTYGDGGTLTGDILHHCVAAQILLSAMPKILFRATVAQTAANKAALACALERYHLANKNYPDNLQSLVSEWIPALPHDVVGGLRYHYRRIDADHYILYSVGWDAKDDGGTTGELLFGRKGDWVWKNSD